MSDAVQVSTISFLSIVVKELWGLSAREEATVTSSVFQGMFVGSLFWGSLADKYGRRPMYLCTTVSIATMAVLTSLSSNKEQLTCCLFLMGVGISGFVIPFDMLAEFCSTKRRAKNLLMLNYFWALGSSSVPVVAKFTIGKDYGYWRLFVLASGVPCVCSAVMGYYYAPESPRWLCEKGFYDEAKNVVAKAEEVNGVSLPVVKSQTSFVSAISEADRHKEEGGRKTWASSYVKLLSKDYRITTLKLWVVWFCKSFTYYGMVLVTTKIFESDDEDFNYDKVLISASSEVIATTMLIFLSGRYGRTSIAQYSYVLGGSFIFLFCKTESVLFSVIGRMAMVLAVNITWVGTPELYDTDVRTTGHSVCSAMSRLGALLSPFVVYSESMTEAQVGLTFLIVASTAGVLSSTLPETKGQIMGKQILTPKSEKDTKFKPSREQIFQDLENYRQIDSD